MHATKSKGKGLKRYSKRLTKKFLQDATPWARDNIFLGIALLLIPPLAAGLRNKTADWQTIKLTLWLYAIALVVYVAVQLIKTAVKLDDERELDVESLESETYELKERVSTLTWPDDRPKLSFSHWGKVEPQFLSADVRSNNLQFAQHGLYLRNDGGTALEVSLRPLQITPELLAVSKEVPRVEAKDNGFMAVWIDSEAASPATRWSLNLALEKGYKETHSNLESIAKSDTFELPIAVTYRDFNNNWYITHSNIRFVLDLFFDNRIEFTAPRQERFTPASVPYAQGYRNE